MRVVSDPADDIACGDGGGKLIASLASDEHTSATKQVRVHLIAAIATVVDGMDSERSKLSIITADASVVATVAIAHDPGAVVRRVDGFSDFDLAFHRLFRLRHDWGSMQLSSQMKARLISA